METQGTKLDARFRFDLYLKPQAGPEYPGLIHLFEHKYDDDVSFWYGIAEVSCEPEDVHKLALTRRSLSWSRSKMDGEGKRLVSLCGRNMNQTIGTCG